MIPELEWTEKERGVKGNRMYPGLTEAMFLVWFLSLSFQHPFCRRSSEISKQHNPLDNCCLGLLPWATFSYNSFRCPKVAYSPPDGSHCRNSNWWGLCLVKTTNCCLKKLLDQFRGHSDSEPTGSPKGPAQEERRHWEEERAVRGWTIHVSATAHPPPHHYSSVRCSNWIPPNIHNVMERKSTILKDKSKCMTYGTESFP